MVDPSRLEPNALLTVLARLGLSRILTERRGADAAKARDAADQRSRRCSKNDLATEQEAERRDAVRSAFNRMMVDPLGFEPRASAVSRQRSNQLSYGSKIYYASGGVGFASPSVLGPQMAVSRSVNSDPLATQNRSIEQGKSSQILLKTPAKSTTALPCQRRVLPLLACENFASRWFSVGESKAKTSQIGAEQGRLSHAISRSVGVTCD